MPDGCPDVLRLEDEWCKAVSSAINGGSSGYMTKSRSAFKKQRYLQTGDAVERRTICGLYPLVECHPSDTAVIHHVFRLAMAVAASSDEKLPPVIGGDQRSARSAYWALWAEDQMPLDIVNHGLYPEVMVVLGFFHWELALYRVLGKFLRGSGLEDALVNSGALTNDRLDKWLAAKMPVKEMRPLYEALYVTLDIMARKDHLESKEFAQTRMTFEEWRETICSTSTMSAYLLNLMRVISIAFNFVDAIREVDVDRLFQMMHMSLPAFYAGDCSNYLKWGSVAFVYLMQWRQNPRCLEAFKKSFCRFDESEIRNSVSLDQATEMTIKEIAITANSGMTQQRLQKLLVADPCLRQITNIVEEELGLPQVSRTTRTTNADPSDIGGKSTDEEHLHLSVFFAGDRL